MQERVADAVRVSEQFLGKTKRNKDLIKRQPARGEGKDIVISTGLDQRQKENFAGGINRLQHRRGIDLAVDRDRNARAHCIGETGVTRIEFFDERLIIGRDNFDSGRTAGPARGERRL